ncbi:MAG: sporulation protein YtfJ [Clostridia bacterium]|jgi:sporulation protein YtfJ|nr:sporulation protein YtfJ [Clostridia bacterium]
MSEHPIEGLMITAMNSIQDMIDVNTIIGEPIETSNNIVIIPISKVCFGFAVGGSEFKGETIDEYSKKEKEEAIQYRLPFGGGSGAGVNINPIAFLIVQQDNVKLLPINHSSSIDKLLDYVPDLVDKMNSFINKAMEDKKEQKIWKQQQKKEEEKENIVPKPKPKKTEPKNIKYEVEYNNTNDKEETKTIEFEEFDKFDD